MRTAPNLNDESDLKELNILNAKPWQVALLEKNPEYPFWGNGEDYMWKKEGEGWDSPMKLKTFAEHFTLDSYNELVNFYFQVYRENHECPHCKGNNLNPATLKISNDWYAFSDEANPSDKWCDKITQDEVEELVKGGRLSDFMPDRNWYRFDNERNQWIVMENNGEWKDRKWVDCEKPQMPTAEIINQAQRGRGKHHHDAINRWICVETRAKRLGVYGHCEHCVEGYIYDEPEARLGLQLWILHPRKGASRGVYIENIEEHEVPAVIQYLKEAAERNANRFSKL
jgi:hypothetical protein